MKNEINFKRMGTIIREKRKSLGITQEQLSEIVDVTPAFIGHIERGERSVSLDTLYSIAEKLNLSYDYLLSEGTCFENSDPFVTAFAKSIKNKSLKSKKAVMEIVETALKYLD